MIEGAEDSLVDVVPLTRAEVARANRTPYAPRSLPAAFQTTAAANVRQTRGGTADLPERPFVPQEQVETLQLRPLPDITPPIYRIGVGDVVLLSTPNSGSTVEQLSGLLAAQSQRRGYTVRDDGTIAIPEIGSISIANLTLQEAEDAIFDTLVSNQINPNFTLEVSEFNSRRATIGGAVQQTAQIPFGLNPITLRDAITAAGGITAPTAQFASIRVYRDGTLYQIPVERYLDDVDLGEAILLPGDAIFVDTTYDLDRALQFYESELDVITRLEEAESRVLSTLQQEIAIQSQALSEQRSLFQTRSEVFSAEPRDFVYFAGELEQSRVALPYEQHATLADVLYENGGFPTVTADSAEIYVIRDGAYEGRDGRIIAFHLDAGDITRMTLATQFQMRPRDIVFVEEQVITKWSRALQQLFPVLLRRVDSAAN